MPLFGVSLVIRRHQKPCQTGRARMRRGTAAKFVSFMVSRSAVRVCPSLFFLSGTFRDQKSSKICKKGSKIYFQNFFSKFCEPRLKIFLTILVPGTKIEKRHLRICGSGLLEIRERKDVIVNDSRKPHQRNCQSSFWDAHRTTFSIRFMFTTNKQHKSPKFVSIANARFFTFSEDCANWSLFKHRSCVHKTGNK